LFLGRGLTLALIISAGLVAPVVERFDTIYVAIQTMFSIFQGPTLAILTLGVVWPRANGVGALSGLLLGVLFSGTLNLIGDQVFPSEDPFLFIAFWSFLFSLIVTAVVSKLTPPPDRRRVVGLVLGEVLHDDQTQRLLRRELDS
jgi:Na+/proline symporter